ncbi:hypothetical protein HDU82_008275, partial [Entophlyctis luteolus]
MASTEDATFIALDGTTVDGTTDTDDNSVVTTDAGATSEIVTTWTRRSSCSGVRDCWSNPSVSTATTQPTTTMQPTSSAILVVINSSASAAAAVAAAASTSDDDGDDTTITILASVLATVVGVVIGVALAVCFWRRRRASKGREPEIGIEYPVTVSSDPLHALPTPQYMMAALMASEPQTADNGYARRQPS